MKLKAGSPKPSQSDRLSELSWQWQCSTEKGVAKILESHEGCLKIIDDLLSIIDENDKEFVQLKKEHNKLKRAYNKLEKLHFTAD